MNGYSYSKPYNQVPNTLNTNNIKSINISPTKPNTRPDHNDPNRQKFKEQPYKPPTLEKPHYGIMKMVTTSPKSCYKGDPSISLTMKKRAEYIGNSGGMSIMNTQETAKNTIALSTGTKSGMMASLWSTNADRKSLQAKHNNFPIKSEFNLQNLRDDPIFHEFQIIRDIGQGKFSKFSVARHKPTSMMFGLKTIKKSTINDQNLMTQLLRQIKILSFLNHPNIVSLYKVFSYGQNIYLVQQLGCDGELYSKMCKRKFSEQTVSFIMRSLLSAISYLHINHIIHRDIKPQNVVLVHGIIKLCDLGWSIHTKSKFRQTVCGTPLYASPELLKGSKYNQKIDLWALGIMAYQLKFGENPFDVKCKSQLNRIITDELDFSSEGVSEQFQHFVKSLLQKDPKQRLTAEMLLKHPFILNYKQFQTCEQLCATYN